MTDDTDTPKARILLIEDNPGDVRLTKKAFDNVGLEHTLTVASDGEKALATLRDSDGGDARDINLILLDLNLPGMSGLDILSVLKADSDLKRIPVVILSSSSENQDIENSYDRHAAAYLSKPTSFQGLERMAGEIKDFWIDEVQYASRE